MLSGDFPRQGTDEYGWTESFIPQLARVTREWPVQEGITVGLYGPWGAGKTTVLNLLESYLHADERRDRYPYTYIARFNPWFYEDQRALTTSFFATLGEVMVTAKKKPWKGAASGLKAMGKFLGAAAAGVSFAGLSLDPKAMAEAGKAISEFGGGIAELAEHGEKPLQEAKKKVVDALRSLGRDGGRVMVFIDDVDRLSRAELLGLFRMVRTVAELPCVTLVLAMDEQRILQILDGVAGEGYGRGYLEKIVQVHMHVPLVGLETLRDQLQKGIIDVLEQADPVIPKSLTKQRVRGRSISLYDFPYLDLLCKLVRTPRDLARFLNGFRVLALTRGEWDLNVPDSIHIAALQVFYPDTYQRVRSNRDFLAAPYMLPQQNAQAEAKKERERRLMEIITGSVSSRALPEHEPVRELINSMFGDVVAGNSCDQREAAAARRVCNWECFDQYFSTIPTLPLTGREVGDFLYVLADYVRSSSDADLLGLLIRSLGDCRSERSKALLANLSVRFVEIDSSLLHDVGKALWRNRDGLDQQAAAWLPAALFEALLRATWEEKQSRGISSGFAEDLVDEWLSSFENPFAGLCWVRFARGGVNENEHVKTALWVAWFLDVERRSRDGERNLYDGLSAIEAIDVVETLVQPPSFVPSEWASLGPRARRLFVEWLQADPPRILEILKEITKGHPVKQLKEGVQKHVHKFLHLVGEVVVARRLLARGIESQDDDPTGLLELFQSALVADTTIEASERPPKSL